MKKSKPSPKKTETLKRLQVLYKGRVQGVGFRYTVDGIAQETGVTGWVRNLPGGDVEVVMEGSEPQINDTLERIRLSAVGKHITKCSKNWQDYRKEFTEFRVEFTY